MTKSLFGLLGIAAVAVGLQASAALAATVIGSSSLLMPSYLDQLEDWVIDDPTLTYDGELVLTNIFTKGIDGTTGSQLLATATGEGPTIVLAQASITVGGQLYSGLLGGYNPQSWGVQSGQVNTPNFNDRTAFIFNLTTGDRRDQSLASSGHGQYQAYSNNTGSFGFGTNGGGLYFMASLNQAVVNNPNFGAPYCTEALLVVGCLSAPNLLGLMTPHNATIGALEVFTLSTVPLAAVPVPAALPMLAAGVGALGLIGWRKRAVAPRAAL